MIISRFPFAAGGIKYAEGTESNAFKAYSYTFTVNTLGFTPQVLYVDVSTYSNVYSSYHQLMVMLNEDGTTRTLISVRGNYTNIPSVTIVDGGFSILVYAPAGNGGSYDSAGGSINYKAWG